jgi:biotin-(acetyl-CoA carboxylase) ligase
MSPGTRPRLRTPLGTQWALPPPFTLVTLREMGDAFAHAISVADEQGAGTLVHVGRFDLAEFALVLEPEEPLAQARRAFYAGMTALADALAAHAQPETSIGIEWPDAIYVNHGLVGGGRLGWPPRASEEQMPAWLVFGATIRTASLSGSEPGFNPQSTDLAEEGFIDLLASQVVDSFTRHFMVAIDAWQEQGFAAVARPYIAHLRAEPGVRRDLDDNGDLLLRRMGKAEVERQPLKPRLKTPSWLDPIAREPRL